MLPELRKHKLAFTIGHEHFSSDEDPVYALVHEHLIEHLALHDLALPSDPRASSDTGTDLLDGPRSLSFHNLPWTVLLKSRILQQKDVKFYYKSDLNGYDVNLRLLKGSQMIKHPEDKNHLLLFIAPRFGDMRLRLRLFNLTPGCACHDELHICAPFRLLKPYIKFAKIKHFDESYFECQEHTCPPCVPCGHGRPPSPPMPAITPPPLPVSRIHHRSPASSADVNPSATRRRRMGSLSVPTMSFVRPLLAGTGLTPGVTAMALTSGRMGIAPLPESAIRSPAGISPLMPSPIQLLSPAPVLPSQRRLQLASSDGSDSEDSSDLFPDVSVADLVSQVNHEARLRSEQTREATLSLDHGLSAITAALPIAQATMQIWCDILTDLMDAHTTEETLEFYGDDLKAVAGALQAYLVYLAQTGSAEEGDVLMWTVPTGIQKFSKFASITEVMCTRARFYRAGRGAGAGVERTVLITAVTNMVSDGAYWADRGSYKVPMFFENNLTNPRRLATWEAFGQLCCLYLFYRKLGPIPVCPTLLMVCLLCSIGPTDDEDFGVLKDRCGGNYGSSAPYMSAVVLPIMSLPMIAAIDQQLAQTLQPWFDLGSNDPTPKEMMHPVLQFVMEILGRNPIEFTSTRTPEDPNSHDNWSCQAFLKVLYQQDTSFLGLREFEVFCRGLMASFPGESDFAQTVAETLDSRDLIPEFVLGLYTRPIDDIDQFIAQRLIFHYTTDQGKKTKGKAKADDMAARQAEQRDVAEQTFVAYFIRYLHGRGHPDHLQLRQTKIIDADDFKLKADSKTLRVEMLLRALTDSPMLPLDDMWCIHFSFPHHTEAGPFLIFHTCTDGVDVLLNDDLLDLLLVEPKGDNASDFDAAVHALLHLAPGEYNDL
ncbi:hypothetical protein K466DRAFT_606558 [Polyporus arcularius HHB13444]|uniref:Uncharacterized protein n=1 Tax=Polyporus arcularius HHB13444 TaxID=1314778 RepID=A0A5C3NNV0_9APHY|nr:hypothetical protein K466DRAFT_606558 [Polyporus arcularius HHB13444]